MPLLGIIPLIFIKYSLNCLDFWTPAIITLSIGEKSGVSRVNSATVTGSIRHFLCCVMLLTNVINMLESCLFTHTKHNTSYRLATCSLEAYNCTNMLGTCLLEAYNCNDMLGTCFLEAYTVMTC